MLSVSGDQDGMCDLAELKEVRARMKAKSWMVLVEGADHGMAVKPKKRIDEVGKLTGRLASRQLDERDDEKTGREIGWDSGNGKCF